jgi:hypothetical protein
VKRKEREKEKRHIKHDEALITILRRERKGSKEKQTHFRHIEAPFTTSLVPLQIS